MLGVCVVLCQFVLVGRIPPLRSRTTQQGDRMAEQSFIAVTAEATLRHHGLDTFEALWTVAGEPVDEPNRARGGTSSVTRLRLIDPDGREHRFYLKRQSNYRIRTLRRPLGESTVAREFHNIDLCARHCVPTMEVAFFAERRLDGQLQSLLLTYDLEAYRPLDDWFEQWSELCYQRQQDLIRASAAIVARLHSCGLVHNCLYPKHLFLRPHPDGVAVRFIDLEKLRAHRLSPWGRKRDLDALNRRSPALSRSQRLRFLLVYLDKNEVDNEVRYWVRRVMQRSAKKERKRMSGSDRPVPRR